MAKLNIENPALNFISEANSSELSARSEVKETATPAPAPAGPAKKNIRGERLNLVLTLDNKIKLQRMVNREGYRSVNDYVNYLVEQAVINEPEPTALEVKTYTQAAKARKKS